MTIDQQHAQIIETHISTIVLLDGRAYKVKRPVRTGFLDFSTREARERACHREVELNRRFSPDSYLGVADILGIDGQPCEHMVVMQRMPQERRLSGLVAQGDDLTTCLQAIAIQVAGFHDAAPRSEETAAQGSAERIWARWRANGTESARFCGSVLDGVQHRRVMDLAERFIEGRRPLFQARAADDRIRDGHGDLLADDIYCLDDGPRILDCLEFDDRLRYTDVIDDAASLAMDLERCGSAEAGSRFMERYLRAFGDGGPPSLVDFYIAYRAFMRTKVACLTSELGHPEQVARAQQLLTIAEKHILAAQVNLVVVGGLPGTGKSTLARALSEEPGWVVVASDSTRKELAGLAPQVSAHARPGGGIYTDGWTRYTYTTLLKRARQHLEQGRNVILDGSWSHRGYREQARDLARLTRSRLTELRCTVDPATARERLAHRVGNASDADWSVALEMEKEFDPWPEAIEIDASASR